MPTLTKHSKNGVTLSHVTGTRPALVTNGTHAHRVQSSDLPQPRIWGMSVVQLHDAFWKSRGVQCVRLGQPVALEAADLYLLLERSQLVLFDLDSLLKQIIWQAACLTAVYVSDETHTYRESAIMDDRGQLQRIERRYGTAAKPRCRTHLTDRPALALSWMHSTTARQWKRNLRQPASGMLLARTRSPGTLANAECSYESGRFLTELVESWPDPERVLEGIEVIAGDVRVQRGERKLEGTIVGPVWIGNQNGATQNVRCVIGPAWMPDHSGDESNSGVVRVLPIREVEASAKPIRPRRKASRQRLYASVKRSLDIVVSALVLTLATPILFFVAIAIVVDDGFPLLFRHRRQSQFGRPFDCLKFRTMHKHAERMVCDLRSRNLCDGPQVHIENDPRVTRVGRVLRKLHLDELPQLWNVLMGDMSLVGPRPSPDAENRICPAWRELRLSVKPGMTGLWQIKRTRKPGHDFQEWIRYDVEYVRRAGLRLDVQLLVQTAWMILTGRRPG